MRKYAHPIINTAVGQAASSSISGLRFARPRTLADYIDWITSQEKLSKEDTWSPDWEISSSDDLDKMEFLSDTLLTRLRTLEGIDLSIIRNYYDAKVLKDILRGAKLALDLQLAVVENDILRLTDPEGFLFSNQIISSIFSEIKGLEL